MLPECNLQWCMRFKASQLDAFCPLTIVYCYIEFKLNYLKI